MIYPEFLQNQSAQSRKRFRGFPATRRSTDQKRSKDYDPNAVCQYRKTTSGWHSYGLLRTLSHASADKSNRYQSFRSMPFLERVFYSDRAGCFLSRLIYWQGNKYPPIVRSFSARSAPVRYFAEKNKNLPLADPARQLRDAVVSRFRGQRQRLFHADWSD